MKSATYLFEIAETLSIMIGKAIAREELRDYLRMSVG